MTAFYVILGIILVVTLYIQLPMFGALPSGERLERIKKSANYKNGSFHNQNETPMVSENFFPALLKFMLPKKRLKPTQALPVEKIDLKSLAKNEDALVWFGHFSYFIQLAGKRILVDPVFFTSSPMLFFPSAFLGTNNYGPEDIPEIDYLLITHDHWDHLDYRSISALKDKVGKFVCGLRVGAHLEKWGVSPDKIVELDWDESFLLGNNFTLHALPSRHFSGRHFLRNKSLWLGYLLVSKDFKLFISGDGGYDNRFEKIGKKFPGIDLALLDSGQYDDGWKYVHMNPDDALLAARDLKTKVLMPAHIAKFTIANHTWDEPMIRAREGGKKEKFVVKIPRIGEKVKLKDSSQKFPDWWVGLD